MTNHLSQSPRATSSADPVASAPTSRDRLRQLFVTASMAFAILGTLYGFGVFGTRVEESSGGALAADATLLAPATRAFSIWSVIYVGLAAYTVWQWLPKATTDARARSIGWLAGASLILNASWLLVTQVGQIWVSVGVILALVVVLGLLVQRLGAGRASGVPEAIVVDGTFGLYLGWVTIATAANITAALVSSGVSFGAADPWIGAAVVAVAAAIGAVLALRLGGRLAVAGALSWGLAWIAVARLTSEPASVVVAVAAIIAVVVVLGSALLVRLRPEYVRGVTAR